MSPPGGDATTTLPSVAGVERGPCPPCCSVNGPPMGSFQRTLPSATATATRRHLPSASPVVKTVLPE
jgi:hypothetical protein